MSYFLEDVHRLILIGETAIKEQNLVVDLLFPEVSINFPVYLLTNCYRKIVRVYKMESGSLVNVVNKQENITF